MNLLERSRAVDNDIIAMDMIYQECDELILKKQFDDINMLFESNPNHFSCIILLSLLSATTINKSKFLSRKKFIEQTEISLRERGEWQENFLDGLK